MVDCHDIIMADHWYIERKYKMGKTVIMTMLATLSLVARADYWMTFCKTPGGQQYSQVGYAKPDADGFVTIKAGANHRGRVQNPGLVPENARRPTARTLRAGDF